MAQQSAGFEDVHEPDEEVVYRRLIELGILPENVTESVRNGYNRSDFTHGGHPVTYQGMVVWGEIAGEFRTRQANAGWRLDDKFNVPRVISPDGKVVVVAVRGNEHTGIRNKHEQLSTRRRRGKAGVRIIRVNTQYVLQLVDGETTIEDLVANLDGTWFLLYNRVGDTVRVEISYAKAVSKTGKLLRWAERLILPDIDLLAPPPTGTRADDSPPEVEVPVSRKAG